MTFGSKVISGNRKVSSTYTSRYDLQRYIIPNMTTIIRLDENGIYAVTFGYQFFPGYRNVSIAVTCRYDFQGHICRIKIRFNLNNVQGTCTYTFGSQIVTGYRNCSYLLPRAAAAGSKGRNKGKIHKVPVDEIARFLVYRIDVIRSQLTANTGIPLCLVREIWQFKVFTGKEVTPLHEEGNSLQFRAGKNAAHFHYKWFIDMWQTDKTERKEKSQCKIVNWKYVTMRWADEKHVSDTTTWRCQEHDRDRMATFAIHLKFLYHVKWQQNAIFHGILEARCSELY